MHTQVGHALARHNTEKIGLGVAVSVGINMLSVALGHSDERATEAQARAEALELERLRRGYHRSSMSLQPVDREELVGEGTAAPAGTASASAYPPVPSPRVPPITYHQPAAALKAQSRGLGQDDAGGLNGPPAALPRWMSQQLLATLSSVLLELPFSRRWVQKECVMHVSSLHQYI